MHQGVTQYDLFDLPPDLRRDLPRYQQILSLDPDQTRRVPNHALKGELVGYRALEIDWNDVAYRLVYRIYDAPAPRRVVVLSFAEHDPAYERAIARRGK
jgi:mRNA-degrading endonuclease YafQ of YafQ-DinJ toxin-antitoxin module